MVDRVVVFIDYQNTYRAARRAFHDHTRDPHWFGQVHPLSLGQYITSTRGDNRRLEMVRIYRGLPSSKHDQRGYSAAQRQNDEWRRRDRTVVITRPLRYLRTNSEVKAEEKGIDVALAIDFAMMAVRGEYDIGVLMSLDTDLLPALEQVAAMPDLTAEVASWKPDDGPSHRLRVKGTETWCHWLPRAAYERMRDNRDYNRPFTGDGQ